MSFHQTYIAGAKFRPDAVERLAQAAPDTSLTLEPEPANPHDPNAIKVLLDGAHVGYVPRDLAAEIGTLIQAGRIERVIRRADSKSRAGIEIHYRADEGAAA